MDMRALRRWVVLGRARLRGTPRFTCGLALILVSVPVEEKMRREIFPMRWESVEERVKIILKNDRWDRRSDSGVLLTFPLLLIFFASLIKRCGTIHRLSDCAMRTFVNEQHCAAIRTWAEISFLSVGWTKRGGKNDGADFLFCMNIFKKRKY